jgi:FAD-dependent urate hydroxylase
LKVAVLGAGVGGLSTAIALKRKGFDVDVYERHRSQTNIGAGIVCWPNASFVLNELEMLDDIAAVAGRPTKMQRLSSRGEDLGSLDILKLNALMEFPSYSILRKDLMKILELHASKLGIDIKYNHAVVKLASTQSEQTEVHLKDGSIIPADLIIGADGRMNSASRAFVNGDNKPIYQRFINWVGVFQCDRQSLMKSP